MAMSYYEKQGSLVSLMEGLQKRGWLIYGFNEDKSDMMTDYWHPASWDGIAVKNGYILVVDVYSNGSIGGDFIHRSYDHKLAKRIQKLQALADNHAASEGERANALAMIEKLDKSVVEEILVQGDKPEVKYQKNPGNSKWHIERNGKIVAKGTGVYAFDNVNTWREEKIIFDDFEVAKHAHASYFNFSTAEAWAESLKWIREKQKDKIKKLDKYFALLEKWDNVATIKLGEGDQEAMIEKTITEIETIYVAVVSDKPTDYVTIGEQWRRTCGLEQYKVYKLTEDKQHVKMLTRQWKKFYGDVNIKNMLGAKRHGSNDIVAYKPEPRGNTNASYFSGTEKDWEDGKFRYVELVPLENKIERTVLVPQKTKKASSKKAKANVTKPETNTKDNTSVDFEELIQNGKMIDYEHTKTHEMLKVVKLDTHLPKEDFKALRQYLKDNDIGYYSSYAKGIVLAKSEDNTAEDIQAEEQQHYEDHENTKLSKISEDDEVIKVINNSVDEVLEKIPSNRRGRDVIKTLIDDIIKLSVQEVYGFEGCLEHFEEYLFNDELKQNLTDKILLAP